VVGLVFGRAAFAQRGTLLKHLYFMTSKASGSPVCEYLVALTVPRARAELLERLARTAAAFFDMTGGAERQSLGRFSRTGRGAPGEVLDLVRFVLAERAGDQQVVVARRLESVLRSALEAAGVEGASARVFLATQEALP
jgi:hypothetical protein